MGIEDDFAPGGWPSNQAEAAGQIASAIDLLMRLAGEFDLPLGQDALARAREVITREAAGPS